MTFVDICAWTVLLVLVRGQFGTRTGDLDSLPPPTRCLAHRAEPNVRVNDP
jgi:hypothetical protein